MQKLIGIEQEYFFCYIFVFMNSKNFMLSLVEHEKMFYDLRAWSFAMFRLC